MSTEIQRDHTGRLHLIADGVPIAGAVVHSLEVTPAGHYHATVTIPLQHLTLGEVKNVVPFVRPGVAGG